MVRSMYAGVASLRTHQMKMDVIGNNIANVNTIGYKSSRAAFKDNLYQTMKGSSNPTADFGGGNARQIGYGAQVASIDVSHAVGGYAPTGLALDAMIAGNGYYIVGPRITGGFASGDGSIAQLNFTRVGNFNFDGQGYLVDSNGYHVYGFTNFNTSDIRVSNPDYSQAQKEYSDFMERVYTIQQFTPNPMHTPALAKEDEMLRAVVTTPMFIPNPAPDALPNEYIMNPDLDIEAYYDSARLANNQKYQQYVMTREIRAGVYHVAANPERELSLVDKVNALYVADYRNEADLTPAEIARILAQESVEDPYNIRVPVAVLNPHFISGRNAEGVDLIPLPIPSFAYSVLNEPAEYRGKNLSLQRYIADENGNPVPNLDYNQTFMNQIMTFTPYTVPQYIINESVTANTNRVNPIQMPRDNTGVPLNLSEINIGQDGIISGINDDNRVVVIGQIALANVPNPSALENSNNSYYKARYNTGLVTANIPGEQATGILAAGGLELANTDLSREFTEMITTQRGFQACTRVITVTDEMLNELVNLKR